MYHPQIFQIAWSGVLLRAVVVGTTGTLTTYLLYDSEQLAYPFCASTSHLWKADANTNELIYDVRA